MLAYRRTSTLAVRALARNCQGGVIVGSKPVGQARAEIGVSIGRRCVFSSLPEHIVVGMPALSPTMTHGNLASWGKQAGDEIAAGDIVCEVETDKATVDFDAQDDSFMAKVLVDAGAQDIPVGTPIFVTVDDAEFVAAFKDFTVAAAESEPETAEPVAAETVAAAEPAPAPVVVAEKEVVVAAAAAVAAEPVPVAAEPVPVAAEPVPVAVEASAAVPLVFRRDWGSGVSGSPLAHRLSAEQKKYIERFGPTLQQPLDL